MKKILIVEDEPDILLLLCQLLKNNYSVITASNGMEAIKENQDQRPDLILMDIMMPIMDGISAIRVIRQNKHRAVLPILVLSAIGDKKKFVEALSAGANDYIPKPFHKSELLARIEVNLRVAELSRELDRKNRQLVEEKKLARRIQEGILPIQPQISSLEAACLYRASDEIGGDFFDIWEKENTVHIMIGDVSGHGTGSALLMAACKGILHTLGQTSDSPLEIVKKANEMVFEMTGNSGMFSTLVYICLDKHTNEMQMTSAGHNPVYIIGKKGIQGMSSTGLPLGFNQHCSWNSHRMVLQPDETVVLYTDGLTESYHNPKNMFGNDRLENVLRQSDSRTPQQIINDVFEQVETFCEGQFQDDVTLLAFKKRL